MDFSEYGDSGAYQEVSELRGELRLRYDISLPNHDDIVDAVEHPYAAELREVWGEVRREGLEGDSDTVQIGRYAFNYSDYDPVTSSAREAKQFPVHSLSRSPWSGRTRRQAWRTRHKSRITRMVP